MHKQPQVLFIRNIVFYIATILWTGICSILFIVVSLVNIKLCIRMTQIWAKGMIACAKYILLNDYKIIGMQNLPSDESYIIACKHQSSWETVIFGTFLENPAFCLKNELMFLPLIGWCLKIIGMIPVYRTPGASKRMHEKTIIAIEKAIMQKRPIIIFPEGTRTESGTQVVYKSGVFVFAKKFGIKVVPAALNSGLFWKRRVFIKKPGTITLSLLPEMTPGDDKHKFMQDLRQKIESETEKLCKK